MYDPDDPVLARLRRVCLDLPETREVEAWGRPTFRAGKIFATYGAGQEHPSGLIIKPDPGDEPALRQDPRFTVPPYYPRWLCIDLDGETDWEEVGELVEASYRQVALKRMLRALDDRRA